MRHASRPSGQIWFGSLLALALAFTGPLAVARHAHAQIPPRPALPPPGSPLLELEPRAAPSLAPGLPRPPAPTPPTTVTGGADHAISRVTIDGVTAYAPDAIERLTQGLIGAAIPEARIEAARQALIDLYRSDGYVYTTANAVLTGAELRLSVVEGYIAEVKLEGDVGPAASQVLRFLNNLVGQKPLRATILERWLLLAQDIPGLTVRSTLNPSLGDPGVLTLIAQMARKSISGLVSTDNRAFNLSGPTQGLLAINFDSFTSLGERTQISFFSAFDYTNRFGQISEEFYLGGSGLKMRLYAGMGTSLPSGQLSVIGYRGQTRVFGGALS